MVVLQAYLILLLIVFLSLFLFKTSFTVTKTVSTLSSPEVMGGDGNDDAVWMNRAGFDFHKNTHF